MIDEFLNSAQSEYDSLKAHCDFIERENRALTKEIEMCYKKIDKLRATRDKAIEYIDILVLGEKENGEPYLFKEDAEGQYLLDILKEVK